MKKFNDPVERVLAEVPAALVELGKQNQDDFSRAARSPTLPITLAIVVIASIAFGAFVLFISR